MGLRSYFAKRVAPRPSVSRMNARLLPPVDRVWQRMFGRSLTGTLLPTLMLTTTGRRSGKQHVSPLLYVAHEGGWVVVGTNFGQDHHPGWTHNLLARPEGVVTVGGRATPVRARQLRGDEYELLWPSFSRLYPGYDVYRARIPRDARMFHLTPA